MVEERLEGVQASPVSKTEQLERYIDALVEHYAAASPTRGNFRLIDDLQIYQKRLAEANRIFREATSEQLTLSYAAEWILDNYYVVRQAIRQIGEDLPRGYYARLPRLETGALAGYPRIYALARALLARHRLRLNIDEVQGILSGFQQRSPLTMGELWALPIFLRYSLIEALAAALERVLAGDQHAPADFSLPDRGPALLPIIADDESPADIAQRGGAAQHGGAVLRGVLEAEPITAQDAVASSIISLRAISELDWKIIFESISQVEALLRQDPTGVYARMDFDTRDRYRDEVEVLAEGSGLSEVDVVRAALALAAEAGGTSPDRGDALAMRRAHVGTYLIAEGRPALEARIGFKPGAKLSMLRWLHRHAEPVYIGSNLLLAALVIFILGITALSGMEQSVGLLPVLLVVVLLFVPALTIANGVVNWLVTLIFKPNRLPKLEFNDGIPEQYRTVIAVPALIGSIEEIDDLVEQIEMHALRSVASGLHFVLLADFPDADEQTKEGDAELVEHAAEAIDALNDRYAQRYGQRRFHLVYRPRRWNPREGKWMGWERKRGKLHELNRLLLGQSHALLFGSPEDAAALRGARYVITLDADTVLPRGAARRLVGTLAHPLNQAIFAGDIQPVAGRPGENRRVVMGYTILQPRVEIHPGSANQSWFTRIFAGDTGLDLYTLAVSDVYQDLFHEGIYVGKGIYDVAAFERSVEGRIPENMLLSHDLLEGLMGRAALVTDITMIEDYPADYFQHALRHHRWIRGDWQLLPWLLRPGRFGLLLSAIGRWKIIDNLRRSLLEPALATLFVLGLLFLPGSSLFWTGFVLFTLGIPVLVSVVRGTLQTVSGERPASAYRPVAWNVLRWLLAVTLLPYEAFKSVDAILTTLYRMLISRKHLLQWTTAAHTALIFKKRSSSFVWRRMGMVLLVVLVLGALVWLLRPSALPGAAPILLAWVLGPQVILWINRPLVFRQVRLTEDQLDHMRRIARQTWGFFERFVGPEDHWLPPDHYQEYPVGMVAHRTSPTNIGLLLNATLAAYDMGYLDMLGLSARLAATFETLERLERYRGHFLNWYDTITLQPLNPRYVSTVDSGNLAASLIVTTQACLEMRERRIFGWKLWQGYLDSLSLLNEVLENWRSLSNRQLAQQIEDVQRQVAEIRTEILAVRHDPGRWYGLFCHLSGGFWQEVSRALVAVIAAGPPGDSRAEQSLRLLRALDEITNQIDRQHRAVQRTIDELVPWIPLLESPPALFQNPPYAEILAELREALPYNPQLGEIRGHIETAGASIARLREQLDTTGGEGDRSAAAWLDTLETSLERAATGSGAVLVGFAQIAAQAEEYVQQMDFTFLYHPIRRVFHIGYNLDAGMLDSNFYDLLASEARIASIVAIAKGDISQQHWLHLARPVTRVEGMRVLLSWSATMFEYLMPPLFLRSYPGTLLEGSTRGAVIHQIQYARSRGVPWGISESGFYRFDSNQSYQYRAFGVPGLGFKRGLADDLVIAPYASLMAVGIEPGAVYQNILALDELGARGLYGYYEALDFTPERLLVGEKMALVREYMTHHQGMILLAMANFFHHDCIVRRMHADPRVQAIELLLQEQIPRAAPLQNPASSTVRGVQRVVPARVEVSPWTIPVQSTVPQVHLLSNGSYSLLISNSGSGYSSWMDVDLTRWQPDRVLDDAGVWIYLQERTGGNGRGESAYGAPWSATLQPAAGDSSEHQVTFFAHMAALRCTHRGILSNTEVTVAPDDPVEIRRVHLSNTTNRPRGLRLTSYGEVILAPQASDARHPAFNKLFIQCEFVPELNLQIFRRRTRSEKETPVFLGHMIVVAPGSLASPGAAIYSREATVPIIQRRSAAHEASRAAFIGRNGDHRRPAALLSAEYLTGSSGATLDPIFSLGQELTLPAHGSARLAWLTFAGRSREEVVALASRYRDWTLIDRVFHQADAAAQTWMGSQNIDGQILRSSLRVLSALIYPSTQSRAAAEILAQNTLGQPGLWRFGISGDYPIILVEIEDAGQLELVREVLVVHRFLRSRRQMVDVVILNHQQTNYGAQLNSMLYRLVSRVNSEQWLNQRGGIFILYADQMLPEERVLLNSAARLVLKGARGTLEAQLPAYTVPVTHLPGFIPTRASGHPPLVPATAPADQERPRPESRLEFFNGHGGFTPDGREYVIEIAPGRPTPAPWVNVIGYPEFGFLVSEAGSQCTWVLNSGENRLTPWFNDPVRDPTGEALYLRDEETGEVWTPTPLPAGEKAAYRARHGAGYTIFEHESHGIRQSLCLYASPDDPLKIIRLRLENTWDHPRRITATQYVEWVLGTTRTVHAPYIIPEYEPDLGCLLARNPYNSEFSQRVAFLAASKPVHGLTADRTEFLGRNGSPRMPAALRRIGLGARIAPGEDPCAALQVHIDLPPGGSDEIYFILGQAEDRQRALELVEQYHDPAQVEAAWERTGQFWDHLLNTIQVELPERAAEPILNRWALYQALSCRLWGRTAFYQSSGAYGFRDQLQDVLALLPIAPHIARDHILNAARHQFDAGDVLHWWHPPSGRGVRTRFSDDLLWLPYVVAHYVEVTGDETLLDEKQPFRHAPPLKPEEEERYGEFPLTEETFSIYEHCCRAIERGATRGPHGLPLIGAGDWNDGFSRVGIEGRGESVWMAWFLIDVLRRFAPICEQRGDHAVAERFRAWAEEYRQAVEKSAWDGAWYRRAYYDSGAPMGSAKSQECQIDAIAQSWSIMSGAGDPQRSRQAMQAVLERLVDPKDRLVLLFTPPFDNTPHDPGYIKGYLPGIRENGGQYTHAAVWTAWAFAALGDGAQAAELFSYLNPIYHADTREKAAVYRVEPYAICADVYSVPPYRRRGGWTWYTGSASWMYRLGLEAILGFRRQGDRLRIQPAIPPSWDRYQISYRYGSAHYHITVRNPRRRSTGVSQITVDGRQLQDGEIPLVDDGRTHEVVVEMGD